MFPTVPKFIRVPYYLSSFYSGATHNSTSNDLYNESAVSPNFKWFIKGWNSFTMTSTYRRFLYPRFTMRSISCYTWILSLEIECWFTSEFIIDLILEVMVDPIKVAHELNKFIHLPILLIELSYLLFRTYYRIKVLFDFISIKFESIFFLWNPCLNRRTRKCICKLILKMFYILSCLSCCCWFGFSIDSSD